MNATAVFRNLHQQSGQPLVLANIWDAGGARLVASLGAKAIATTSAGVAWSLGYADGNTLPFDELAHVVRGVVRAVSLPVTIDAEAGYSDDPAKVVERLEPVFESGVAGINLEDGTGAPSVLARKIEAIKQRTASLGLDLFVNARADVYLRNLSPDEEKVAETLRRAKMYQQAGADGLFVPAIRDKVQIGEVTRGTELPLNVMGVPGLPKLPELAQLNVRRLSAGSALSQALWQQLSRLAQKFLAEGDAALFAGEGMDYGRLQALISGPR